MGGFGLGRREYPDGDARGRVVQSRLTKALGGAGSFARLRYRRGSRGAGRLGAAVAAG